MPFASARTWGLILVLAAVGTAAWLLVRGSADPAPVAIKPRPEAATRPPPTLVASLRVARALGTLVEGFGSAWADDRAAERLVRIDPARGRVTARVALRGRATVSAGAGAVWALQSGRRTVNAFAGPLLRIDPRTSRVRARIALRRPDGRRVVAFGVLAGPRGVWIWGPRELLHVDRAGRRVDAAFDLPTAAGEVTGAALHRGVVVLGTADGRLLRRHARTGRPLGEARTGLPLTGVVAGGRDVLLVASGVLAAADPGTGAVRWRRRLGYRIGGALIHRGLVWTQASPPRRPRDVLVALDPRTGARVAEAELDELGTFALAAIDRRLWMSTAGGRLVVMQP